MPAPHHRAPGALIAEDYRIVRRLARGGMGEVYVAEQLSTGKLRALKLMHPGTVHDAASRRRFQQEARVGARIDSDHVVEVVGAGVDPASDQPWLAMELLAGEDLAALVARRGALAPGDAREVLAQLCHALAAAHRAGVVHRDIKPENVFVALPRRRDAGFTVRVLDFGIAKLTLERRTAGGGVTAAAGSPLWMAPEQCEAGGAIAPGTDVWAVGLVAFYLLTGTRYWRAAHAAEFSPTAALSEILLAPLPAASARARDLGCRAALPAGFDAWFARCVSRAVDARFADAGAAMDALAPLLPGPVDPCLVQAAPSDPGESAGEPVSRPPEVSQPTPVSRPAGHPASGRGLTVPEHGPTLPAAGAAAPSVLVDTNSPRAVTLVPRPAPRGAAVGRRLVAAATLAAGVLAVAWYSARARGGPSRSAASAHAGVGAPGPARAPRASPELAGAAAGTPANHPAPGARDGAALPYVPGATRAHAALALTAPEVRQCAGASGERSTHVGVVFASDGSVRHVGLRPPFVGTPQGECIVRAVRRARVAPFARESAVSYFRFRFDESPAP